jgi:hypothetical protein
LSTRAMSETEAKQRANRRFDVAERRSREEATRIAEQKKAEVSDAAKIQRLRALRLARDAALAEEAAAAPPPVPKTRVRKAKA